MKLPLLIMVLWAAQTAWADCPGLELARSCGDGACDFARGETAATCPVDCARGPLHSYNFQTFCPNPGRVLVPASVEEASEALKAAAGPVRIVGRRHSSNSQLCSAGLVLVTEKLDRIVGIEKIGDVETVTVEGGATIGAVAEWLADHELSLGYAIPNFRGISIAGAMATGSHGDSLKHPALLSSLVESITLLTPSGEIKTLRKDEGEDFRAATTNLGMLGLIARVSLRVRPQFKIRMQVSTESDDYVFREGGIESKALECDFSQLQWFPSSKQVVRYCGTEAPERALDAGAENQALYPDSTPKEIRMARVWMQRAACSKTVNHGLEFIQSILMDHKAVFVKNDRHGKARSSKDVTGLSHRMLTTAMNPYPGAMPNVDYSVSIPMKGSRRAIAEIARRVQENGLAFPMVGITFRFARADDWSLLADSAASAITPAGQSVLMIEFNLYRPLGFGTTELQAWFAPYEEIMRMLIRDFGGRAHWGKNTDALFAFQREQGSHGDALNRFERVRKIFDPQGRLRNYFSDLAGL